MNYIVHNKYGTILKSGSCPISQFSNQADMLNEEYIIEGVADDLTEKIEAGKIIKLTSDEISLCNYSTRKNFKPILDQEQPIDTQIDAFFMGQLIDIQSWKEDNYRVLRKQAYPKIELFVDAHVKMQSIDSAMSAEGTAQLDKYYQDCIAVKIKYPKVKK